MPLSYLQTPQAMSQSITFDLLVALAYLVISIGLARLAYKRKGTSDHWLLTLFAIFFVFRGIALSIRPFASGLPEAFDSVIEVLSISTALSVAALFWFKLPQLLKLPTSEQLERSNNALQEALRSRDEALRNASLLAALVDSSSDVIISESTEREITHWNQAAERMFGYSAAEILGQSTRVLMPRGFDDEDAQIARGVREGIPIQNLDSLRMHRNGSAVPVSLTVSPIYDPDTHAVLGASKIIRDLSPRLKLLEKFQQLFNAAPDAMVMINSSGQIALVNTEAERLFGYSRQELIGKAVEILMPERFRGVHSILRGQFSAAPEIVAPRAMGHGGEILGLRKDGSEFPVQVSLNPFETDEGAMVISAIRDITEAARKEATIRQLNDELEYRVTQRTAELNQSRRQLQRMLDGSTNVSIVATDPAGLITVFNSGAENMLGYRADEMVGKCSPIAYHLLPEIQQRAQEIQARTGKSVSGVNVLSGSSRCGQHDEREWTYVRKDGRHITVNLVITALWEDDQIVGFLGVAMDITQRKQIERQREELSAQVSLSEARYRAYMEQAADTILVHDHSGRMLEVNERACLSLGYTREELLSLNVLDVHLDEDERAIDLDTAQSLFSQISPTYSPTISGKQRRKDGSTFPVEIRIGCFEVNGERSYLADIRDVSERKIAEASARASAERLRLLVDSVKGYAIMMLDAKGNIASWNAGAERLFGYQSSEAEGMPLSQFFLPEDVAEGRPAAELKLADEQGTLALEGQRLRKDGSRFLADVVTVPMRDEKGLLLGFASVIQDITSRKSHESQMLTRTAQLEEANHNLNVTARRLELTKNALRAGIWSWDVQTNGVEWDEQMYTIYGLPDGSPVSYATWAAAVLPQDFEQAAEKLNTIVATNSQGSGEFRIRRPDGSIRFIQAGWAAVVDKNNIATHAIGINIDTTERKFNEALERQVSERTSQLTAKEEQLRRSLLEKETLLKEVHHRVKNNLQIISSLLRMQGSVLEDALAKAALQESQRRVLSMALIHERLYGRQLMDRIEFGEYAKALVSDLLQSYAADASHLSAQIETSPVLLTLDQAIPCGLILNELVTNTIKYAHPDGAAGTLKVQLWTNDSNEVNLKISDDGVGLPHGFDWRSSNSMGLPIVDMLVEQIGGSIKVYSPPGTTFEICFPHHSVSVAPESKPASLAEPAGRVK